MKTYIPSKVLTGSLTNVTPLKYWPMKEFDEDEYWSGGITPKYYQWEMTFSVDSQSHSSPVTRVPYSYNGLDIVSGMWITDVSGAVLRIINVVEKTETTVVVNVEDEYRINAFKDQSGNASGEFQASGTKIFFELDDKGMPILDPVPGDFNISNANSALSSRFQIWNNNTRYGIVQENHQIEKSDIVVVNPNTSLYEPLSYSNRLYPVVGTALETYPSRFYISPVNRVVRNLLPSMPGNVGDFVYYDGTTGEYTNQKTNNRVYLKLTQEKESFVIGDVEFTSRTTGTSFTINEYPITVTSTDLQSFLDLINNTTSFHNVVASTVSPPTIAESDINDTAYGTIVVGYPASFEINGTLVTFDPNDGSTYAFIDKIVEIINDANVPNITAENRSGILTLINSSGGDIILTNIQTDSYGNPVAGPSSGTGLPLNTTSSQSSVFIKLSRADGSYINVKDVSGNNMSELGLYSVQNGRVPDVMVVENWDRKADNYVVQDISERDNLTSLLVGDEAFVNDTGNGEWSKWLYDGSQWKLIATEDSARTDADVLSIELTSADTGTHLVGTVSNNSRVANVTVEVTQAFDDVNATLNVGDSAVNDRLMSEDIIDLTETGTYTFTPSHVYNNGGDTDLNAYLNTGTSTVGALKVIISYS